MDLINNIKNIKEIKSSLSSINPKTKKKTEYYLDLLRRSLENEKKYQNRQTVIKMIEVKIRKLEKSII